MCPRQVFDSALVVALSATVATADITNLTQGTTHATIQEAINASVNGDEIVVDPGLYSERLDLLGRQITLRSQDPLDPAIVADTVIDGGGSGTVITCDSGETADTHIAGFVVTGGVGDGAPAAALCIDTSGPTVSYCVFERHSGVDLLCVVRSDSGSPTFEHCAFSNNAAGSALTEETYCAALVIYAGSATVSHCSFGGNSATASMDATCVGIQVVNATVSISDCDLSAMFAAGTDTDFGHASAAGLRVDGSAGATSLSRCRLALNTAIAYDGASGGRHRRHCSRSAAHPQRLHHHRQLGRADPRRLHRWRRQHDPRLPAAPPPSRLIPARRTSTATASSTSRISACSSPSTTTPVPESAPIPPPPLLCWRRYEQRIPTDASAARHARFLPR